MNASPLASIEASPLPDTKRAIVGLIEAWADAWNAHDMQRARGLVAADVDFVTVAGLWLKGGEEFLSHHREIHRMRMRESRWTNLGYELRSVRDDLCLVHLEWTTAGDREPDGTPRARRYGLFTWLIERRGDTWHIIAVHNSDLRAGVRHRLSGEGGDGPSTRETRP
jgi:uncharacterized protein (TIGR02246 family)